MRDSGVGVDLCGRVVGRCRIERLLGTGGMGAVYLATHEALQIPVAVKFLFAQGYDGSAPDEEAAARFVREARLAARLEHPNIVRVYDVVAEGGLYYIIMALLPGVSLGDVLAERGALAVDEVRRIGRQVALALAHAHARGVIHRDIKPDNVMVSPDGAVVLTDFGIASMGDRGQRLTQQGIVVGTPWYLAPEQATGGRMSVDARADIYALGVMLYELLTNALPFEGEEPMAQLVARLTCDPYPIAQRRGDLPPALVALIGRMLARDPAQRVQTADEVAAALADPTPSSPALATTAQYPTASQPALDTRTSQLVAVAVGAGLALNAPDVIQLLDLRLADVRATLRLAEAESAAGPVLFSAHRGDEAWLVALKRGAAVLALRLARGAPAPASPGEVVAAALQKGDGALVVRRATEGALTALRCWLAGVRQLGPLPTDIFSARGLLGRIARSRLSGVLAVTDRGQTTLATFSEGALAEVLAAPQHRQEIAADTLAALGGWLEACGPEATLSLHLAVAEEATRAAVLPEATLRDALAATVEAVDALASAARREFGVASAQVFSTYLRDATARYRDVVPVAALGGATRAVELVPMWEALLRGASSDRDAAVRAVIEALLAGALQAANTVLPGKKSAKPRQAALAALLRAQPALDALGLTDAVQRALAG